MVRELTYQEAAKHGLPSRCPLSPYEPVVWFGDSEDIGTVPLPKSADKVCASLGCRE
jgi:hypothetical protein